MYGTVKHLNIKCKSSEHNLLFLLITYYIPFDSIRDEAYVRLCVDTVLLPLPHADHVIIALLHSQ